MTSVAIRNIAEAFFRHWLLYLAIFAGSLALGVVAVVNSTDEYTASGSVFVDTQSLVANQIGVRETGGFSFLSPAQFTSQELNGLVSTEVFMDAALEGAGVDLDPDPGTAQAQVERLRQSVGASAGSENLVAVTVTTPDPELSFRVAGGVIEEFVRLKIDLDVTESGASEQFFSDLVDAYEQDLTEARDAVEASLRGATNLEQLPLVRQFELERLQQEEQLIEERYTSALESLEASRLATLQTETDVRQRYSVFDPPVVPVEPNGGLFDDLVVVLASAIVGLGLAVVATLIGAAMNRAVTFADDIKPETAGTSVVAVLPRVKKREVGLTGTTLDLSGGNAGSSHELGQQTITIVPTEDQEDGESYLPADAMEQVLEPNASEDKADAATKPAKPTSKPAKATKRTSKSARPAKPAKPAKPATAPPGKPAEKVTADESASDAAPVPVVAEPSTASAKQRAEAKSVSEIPDGGLAIVESSAVPEQPVAPTLAGADDGNGSTRAEAGGSDGDASDTETVSEDMEKLLQTTSLGEDWQLPEPPAAPVQPGGAPPSPAKRSAGDDVNGGQDG